MFTKKEFHKNRDYKSVDLVGNEYKEFISYALKKSDYFSFQLPNYEHYLITPRNEALLPDEFKEDIRNIDDNQKENKEFVKYKLKTAEQMNLISKDIVFTCYDVSYFDNVYSYGTEGYVVQNNDPDSCIKFLTAAQSLFSWTADNYPEDLYFFAQGKCWMKIRSHDKILYLEEKERENFLKTYNIPCFRLSEDIALSSVYPIEEQLH